MCFNSQSYNDGLSDRLIDGYGPPEDLPAFCAMTDRQLDHVRTHMENVTRYADSHRDVIAGVAVALQYWPSHPGLVLAANALLAGADLRYKAWSDFAQAASELADNQRDSRSGNSDPLKDGDPSTDPSNPNDSCDPRQRRDPGGAGNADGDLPGSGPFLTPPPSPLVFDLDGDVDPASRGSYIDARYLAFLEALYGERYKSTIWTNPGSNAGAAN